MEKQSLRRDSKGEKQPTNMQLILEQNSNNIDILYNLTASNNDVWLVIFQVMALINQMLHALQPLWVGCLTGSAPIFSFPRYNGYNKVYMHDPMREDHSSNV